MDELQAKHRKEQRDLQSRITQKKKNATKKTRKGVNDECERLEIDLAAKQKAEIDALNGIKLEVSLDMMTIEDDNQTIGKDLPAKVEETRKVHFDPGSTKVEAGEADQQSKSKKPNRQKARLARRAAEQEAQIAAAEEEAANLPDRRQQELTSMKTYMEKMGMQETFIRPDGHCLYSACAMGIPADEIKASGSFSQGYQNVRSATAEFISKHPDDFSAFLEEPLEVYVKKIRDTAEWGGQLELQAISHAYNVKINVLQSDGRIEKFHPKESTDSKGEVWLAYYRHSFGLGEHYNSLRKVEI